MLRSVGLMCNASRYDGSGSKFLSDLKSGLIFECMGASNGARCAAVQSRHDYATVQSSARNKGIPRYMMR